VQVGAGEADAVDVADDGSGAIVVGEEHETGAEGYMPTRSGSEIRAANPYARPRALAKNPPTSTNGSNVATPPDER
jgi:hypothetical protein